MIDLSSADPVVTASSVGLSLGLLAWRGLARQQRQDEQYKTEQLSVGPRGDVLTPEQVHVFTGDELANDSHAQNLANSLIIGLCGTFGVRGGRTQLATLALAGLAPAVSTIFVVEPDENARAEFEERTPAVFQDRIVHGHPTDHGGGFDGAPVEEVLNESDLWGNVVIAGAEEAIYRHLHRARNRFPKIILLYVGQGGSAPLLSLGLEALKEQFGCLVVAVTALPEFLELRQRFPAFKDWYERFGVDVWLPVDNLQPDYASIDYAIAALITGLLEAPRHADAATHLNNIIRQASPKHALPGAVLLLRVLRPRPLASYTYTPVPGGPSRYYTTRGPVRDQIIKTARRLDEGEGQMSAEVPVDSQQAVVDLFSLPLNHDDLVEMTDAVQRGRWTRARTLDAFYNQRSPNGHLYRRPNYALLASRLPTVMEDPSRPRFPIMAMRLIAAAYTDDLAEQLTRIPQERDLHGPMVEVLAAPVEAVHAQRRSEAGGAA